METQNESGVAAPPKKISLEIIKARFSTELTKLKYQAGLQALQSYTVTEDNISEAQEKIKKGRKFITQMKDIHKEGKSPAWEECGYWDTALKDFLNPLESALKEKSDTIQKIGNEQAERKRKEEAERQRKESINMSINHFILTTSQQIAEAKTDTQLVAIEKLIGSHKANSARYAEFLPDLVSRCNELTPILKTQKEQVRKLEEIKKQELEALAAGDDEKAIELAEKKEVIADKIEEVKITVQEVAIEGATRVQENEGATQLFTAPKARRTTIEFEIVDEKKAFEAGMLLVEINKDKAKEQVQLLKEKSGDKDINEVVNGIRFFTQRVY